MIDEEPFMGSGRGMDITSVLTSCLFFSPTYILISYVSMTARAYMLGYSCHDEKELEACLRFW